MQNTTMKTIPYSVHYENNIPERDALALYGPKQHSLKALATDIAKAYLCDEVYDWDDEEAGLASFGSITATAIAPRTFEVRFRDFGFGIVANGGETVTVKFGKTTTHD
jgi:hypothetical protein